MRMAIMLVVVGMLMSSCSRPEHKERAGNYVVSDSIFDHFSGTWAAANSYDFRLTVMNNKAIKVWNFHDEPRWLLLKMTTPDSAVFGPEDLTEYQKNYEIKGRFVQDTFYFQLYYVNDIGDPRGRRGYAVLKD